MGVQSAPRNAADLRAAPLARTERSCTQLNSAGPHAASTRNVDGPGIWMPCTCLWLRALQGGAFQARESLTSTSSFASPSEGVRLEFATCLVVRSPARRAVSASAWGSRHVETP